MNQCIRLAAIAAVVFPVALFAQQKPDLSGRWLMDTTRSQSTQSDPRPVTVVITQRGDEHHIAEYSFDNEAKPKAIGTSGRSTATGTGTIMQWDGNQLVTSTPYSINDAPLTVLERRSLSPDGSEMTVERTVTVQHGYESRGGSPSTADKNYPARDVFIRAPLKP